VPCLSSVVQPAVNSAISCGTRRNYKRDKSLAVLSPESPIVVSRFILLFPSLFLCFPSHDIAGGCRSPSLSSARLLNVTARLASAFSARLIFVDVMRISLLSCRRQLGSARDNERPACCSAPRKMRKGKQLSKQLALLVSLRNQSRMIYSERVTSLTCESL